MIDKVNRNFKKLDVRNIVIMDTVLGVTNQVIPCNITFQPGFTSYIADGIDFDIDAQLMTLMLGERADILFNRHPAVAQ